MKIVANPKTTRMALKEDLEHRNTYNRCYDIYASRRFLWIFWTPFRKTWKYVFAACKGKAWYKAYKVIYGDMYYGPEERVNV